MYHKYKDIEEIQCMIDNHNPISGVQKNDKTFAIVISTGRKQNLTYLKVNVTHSKYLKEFNMNLHVLNAIDDINTVAGKCFNKVEIERELMRFNSALAH